jgi:hypothetical protein
MQEAAEAARPKLPTNNAANDAEIAQRRAANAKLERQAAERDRLRQSQGRPAGYTGCKKEPGSKSSCVSPQ